MKAITVRQPYASLIAEGVKSIETRPKRSPWHCAIGETIAIHAAVRKPDHARRDGWFAFPARMSGPLDSWVLRREGQDWPLNGKPMPLGAVVATCTLRDVVPMVSPHTLDVLDRHLAIHDDRLRLYGAGEIETRVDDQRPYGDFAPGRFALLLDNVEKLAHPVPVRGKQGLWTVPDEIAGSLFGVCA